MFRGKDPFVVGSVGVSDLSSAVQQIMVGADAVWICTETMVRGFARMAKMPEGLKAWTKEMGYSRIADFRDLLLGNITPASELRIHEGYAAVDLAECNACGACWNIGHCSAITHPDDRTTIDAAACPGRSTGVDVCPRDAIAMVDRGT